MGGRRRRARLDPQRPRAPPAPAAAPRLPSVAALAGGPTIASVGLDELLRHNREAASHLRWLRQKDSLGNDVVLLGVGPIRRYASPGRTGADSPKSVPPHSSLWLLFFCARWLALHYCSLANREVEYVALTRDTTEGDLKQRREIIAGGTSVYTDSPVVAAALNGRVLILDGLERAEVRPLLCFPGRALPVAPRADSLPLLVCAPLPCPCSEMFCRS